ncbi:MAG: hypothetical protein HQ492_02235, partial [Woeseiaceae bacterium]|nr:hypothetical protein [Woeseiaceae bacterium]
MTETIRLRFFDGQKLERTDTGKPVEAFLILLSMTTLLPALWLALCGRTVIIIGVESGFGATQALLNLASRYLVARWPNCQTVDDLWPRLPKGLLTWWNARFPDFFLRIERMQNDRFRFDEIDGLLGEYAYAYKHEVCAATHDYLNQIHRTIAATEVFLPDSCAVIGLDAYALELYAEYFGHPLPVRCNPISYETGLFGLLRRGSNATIAICTIGYGIIWCLRRVALRSKPVKQYFMGSDIVAYDRRHARILRQICHGSRRLLLVMRNRPELELSQTWDQAQHVETCLRSEGHIERRDLLWTLKAIVLHTARIHSACRSYPGRLHSRLVRQPFLRVMYRAFFTAHSFKFYFGKDDYNTEHIMRTIEARRKGIVTLGNSHGITAPEGVHPSFRYIDFDIYFTFGRFFYESYYKSSWPPHMKVVATGSYGMERQHMERMNLQSRDIAVFYSAVYENDETIEFIDQVARLLPNRKIFIKHKQTVAPDIDEPTV